MPGLRRLFSSLTLRKEPKDEGEMPKAAAQPLLKRSNAVLRKRSRVVYIEDQLLHEGAHHDQDFHDRGHIDDDLRKRSFRPRGLRYPTKDFENEMHAVAEIRAERRHSLPLQRNSKNKKFSGTLEAPNSDAKARSGLQHVSQLYRAASKIESLDSQRYLDPLRAVREGPFQPYQPGPVSIAFPTSHEPIVPEMGPPQQPESMHEGVALHVDRDAWVYHGPQRMLKYGRSSPHGEQSETLRSSASSSMADSAVVMSKGKHVVPRIGKGKETMKNTRVSDARQHRAEGSASGRRSLSNRSTSVIEQYSDAMEHPPQTSGEQNATVATVEAVSGQIALMLATGQLSDEQLDTILHNPQLFSLQQRDCLVCGDTKSVPDFPARPPTTPCSHESQTCSDCLSTWLTSEISSKGSVGIICPECPSLLSHFDIQRLASPSTFATYDRLATRAALGSLRDFSWCLSPTCPSGQENPHTANYMDCHACGYKQCLSHRRAWHTDETCAQYDYRTSGRKARDEERKTEAMLDAVSRMCPNPACGWRIQKVDGCDHMTCRRCGFEFCWVCGAAQGEIRRVGNTAHGAACRYHSKNLHVAWPFNAH